jgi:hypothetical protein
LATTATLDDASIRGPGGHDRRLGRRLAAAEMDEAQFRQTRRVLETALRMFNERAELARRLAAAQRKRGRLWRDLKQHHLAHRTFAGPQDLDRAIHDAVAALNAERRRHPLGSQQIAA